jgi:N-acetylated-alpha-linked acidic dipeptidase
VFASWDGEEYGLVGSTEWVEEFLPWLRDANVAYIVGNFLLDPALSPSVVNKNANKQNTDVSTRGTNLKVSAAPLLDNIIHAATAAVPSPNQTVPGQTVHDLWDKRISTMGSGSDFTAFQDFAGIPSLDIGFDSGPGEAVYHYHSNYDSFHWMEKFGDPGFIYHRTMAQVLGLITAQLADQPLISFRAADYAHALDRYVQKVEDKLNSVLSPTTTTEIDMASLTDDKLYFELRGSTHHHNNSSLTPFSLASGQSFKHSLKRLHRALTKLTKRAASLDEHADRLRDQVRRGGHLPWWKWPAKLKLGLEIRRVNTKYKYLERSFLFEQGLDGRPWFKHVVFAPGLWTGYAGGKFYFLVFISGSMVPGGWCVVRERRESADEMTAVFPGLVESIDNQDWSNAERWVDIIESRIRNAAHGL